MVYLIGVDHLIQYRGPVPEILREEFKEYLAARVRELGITLIAEEFSEEALGDVYESAEATCRGAAAAAGIDHRFCDPEEEDRQRLGIPSWADAMDGVKKKYGITEKVILNDALRRAVLDETRAVVRSFFPARERFWLERLRDRIGENILFTCGWEHIPSFCDLLTAEGAGCAILNPFWRGDLFGDYALLGL